jgi:glycosyltransferase involved in cell wall biosynthesis
MPKRLTVAWISDYPLEWMAEVPEPLRGLPRQHPATWMPVLFEEFRRRSDLELHILVLRKGISSNYSFERDGVRFHVLKTIGGLRSPSLFWHDTLLIRRALREIRPDLVHAWGTERGAGLVAQRMNYPYVVTIQGLLTWYKEVIPLHAYDRFTALIEGYCLRRARVVTTESSFAVRFLRERFPHLEVRQAEHAPNRIFHEVQRRPVPGRMRLLSVGTFGHRKGSDVLLRALDRLLPELEFELIVVGSPDPKWLAPLKAALSPQLWTRVHFKSGLPPFAVAAELAETTMAVLPTRVDTSPNAVKEAVVAGVPVVATRVGGILDYVIPGANGVLCDAGDVEGLTDALREACRHPLFSKGQVDPSTLAQMRAYLSPEQMGRNFFEAYLAARGQKP